ncbi:MAG: SDR family oxidoreductase [Opitutales bacterium]
MKILITGASGLLGNACAETAVRRGHEVIALWHSYPPPATGLARTLQIDASKPETLTSMSLDIWPDAIINAAALSTPAAVDANPELAEALNVMLPRHLAQIANHLGARFLHASTDMVFDGRATSPYRSTDMPAPTNPYGQTKLMAEREVLEHNPEDPVILRLPILMGNSPRGERSIHEKILAALARNERPALFEDEIRQPCSASNAAEVFIELAERRDLHGIFHWAGAETLTRLEIGRRILRHFNLAEENITTARQSDDPQYENRPAHLTFNLHPVAGKLKTTPATFDEQLDELRIPPHLKKEIRERRQSK